MNYLAHAVDLAAQIAPHHTAPNPRVGCLIVHNDRIVAQGVHEHFGGPHAEQNTLDNLQSSNFNLQDSIVYITLEPCDHFPGKKTSSCTELLMAAKPKKIIVGSLDPQFNGQSIKRLRASGIEVEVQENEFCKSLNPFFEKYITTKLPYLTLKVAQSLDGKIVSPHGKWITNETSRQKVHQMRAQYSAILTTTKTIQDDNPALTCRLNGFPPLTKGGRGGVTSTNLKVHSHPHLLILGTESDVPKAARIYQAPERNIHFFDTRSLSEVLHQCHDMKIDSIMTECGGAMNTALLETGLVDEIHLFIAPKIFDGHLKSSFQKHIEMHDFRLETIEDLEGDLLLTYKNSSPCLS